MRPAPRAPAALAIGVALLLGACGSDREITGDIRLLADALREPVVRAATRATAPADAPASLTPAQVDASPVALMIVTPQNIGTTAVFGATGRNGPVVTYTSADRVTVALDRGVLVATRGLLADLMSADAPSATALAAGAGSHRRSHFLLGPLDRQIRQDFDCALASGGSEVVQIAGRAWTTRVVTETCAGPSGRFVNRYWVEPGGRIRQSEQWINPRVGTVRLSDPGLALP
ncbi:MAG: YjbF family lipoprotein [Gemmobacter sp.]